LNTFSAELIQRIKRTPSVESFCFKTSEKITFAPGQFVKVVFDDKALQNKDLNKYLSFSVSPEKDYVEVTKRLSESSFSARLKGLKLGDSLLMQGPMGNCIFKEDYKKIGFLIGGIGITPVISILEYIMEKKLGIDIILFYSNRNKEEIAFRRELDSWNRLNENMQVVYTVTDCEPKDDICVHGHISGELLSGRLQDLTARRFFIYGPPVMVKAMKDLCVESGCDKNWIMAENFIGY